MKNPSFKLCRAGFTLGLLFTSVVALQAREGDSGGGNDGGHGGGGGKGEAEFFGRVETLPTGAALAGSWQVNGVRFLVDAATAVDQSQGRIAVGSLVEVRTLRQADGSLKASRVEDQDQRGENFGEAEFAGKVTALPLTPGFVGTWTVGDRLVVVDAATALDTSRGAVAVGSTVEVAGRVLSDGSVAAAKVKVEDLGNEAEVENHHFTGVIESLPAGGTVGTWKVSGLSIVVTAATRIEAEGGAPAVGSTVRIEGVQQPDASIAASEISVARAAFGDDAAEVELVGHVEQLPDNKKHVGNWTVEGVTVTITPASAFDAANGQKPRKASSGSEVEVHGRRQADGSILVTSAVVAFAGHETGHHFLKYDGVVASAQPATATQPGTLILTGGQVVTFDDATQFANGTPVVGSTVSVKASHGQDGTDAAHKVKVK